MSAVVRRAFFPLLSCSVTSTPSGSYFSARCKKPPLFEIADEVGLIAESAACLVRRSKRSRRDDLDGQQKEWNFKYPPKLYE
jgi:hypothetical protein